MNNAPQTDEDSNDVFYNSYMIQFIEELKFDDDEK
jgi:hypothetical protein